MKNNQFISNIVSQGNRRFIEIPKKYLNSFADFGKKDLKITLVEI